MITQRKINDVIISHDFYQLSEKIGYTADIILDYQQEIGQLIQTWKLAKCVEIYQDNSDYAYGRIKDTNSTDGSSPYYIGVFHSRVLPDDNDPLLVLTFSGDVLMIRMFADHDELFGTFQEKHNKSKLKSIKQRISSFLFKK
ncbi:hypothetical protein [Gallibacterium genomosp. 1]|uniref:hypothetical protein n=1 Tax=Gallibacterium genomosp. 1 TaxID=155515 RepID=UPI00068B6456|nr:hypothetical protein [Gallibacterium genomosp. 1]